MNITRIEFHDGELRMGINGCANGSYRAQFVLTADGTDYTGTAWLDVWEGFDMEWDAAEPDDDDFDYGILMDAFFQSVALEVVCRPVESKDVLPELVAQREQAATESPMRQIKETFDEEEDQDQG
jgi:hypothetical protein